MLFVIQGERARCGARRPCNGEPCRRWPSRGEKRCAFHSARHLGDWWGRHRTPEQFAAHVVKMAAGRAAGWNWRASGEPYPASRKKGAGFGRLRPWRSCDGILQV